MQAIHYIAWWTKSVRLHRADSAASVVCACCQLVDGFVLRVPLIGSNSSNNIDMASVHFCCIPANTCAIIKRL